MTAKHPSKFTVITNDDVINVREPERDSQTSYQTNPMYEKLMQFRNLQEQQKKKFSVDDLFKLC